MISIDMQAIASLTPSTRQQSASSLEETFGIALKKAQTETEQENVVSSKKQPKQSPAAQELAEWLAMSPGERLFFSVLASMGVSKEQFEGLSQEEQMALTHKVQERIKEMAQDGSHQAAAVA